MNLSCRAARDSDFEGFWRACYASFGFGEDIRHCVRREWRMLLGCPTTLTTIVEKCDSEAVVVACAVAAFLSDEFARWAWSDMPPYINARLLEALSSGARPLLSEEEVQRANSTSGLHLLFAHWGWAEALLTEAEGRMVREYLARAAQMRYRGYQLASMTMEVVGPRARNMAAHSGLPTIRDYGECPEVQDLPAEMRPYLMGTTRDQALKREGCLVSAAFVYDPPRLHLRPLEQELLQLAVEGASDEEIAGSLGITRAAVKKRWLAAFLQISEVDPDLAPGGMDGVRGPEKRSSLIRYLRNHLEELRPMAPASQPCRRGRT